MQLKFQCVVRLRKCPRLLVVNAGPEHTNAKISGDLTASHVLCTGALWLHCKSVGVPRR